VSAADRAIRISTAAAVLGVAGIAAYVSYWHAYEVVRAHGESGVTARLEPATIDGLVYASSMVVLYAARHQLAVPALARWLLAMGIVATLAANVAHGWPNGPIGAAVAAWPAASLVGSYELLLWLVRTAATGAAAREPAADQESGPVDHLVRELRLVPMPDAVGAEHDGASGNHAMPGGHKDRCVVPAGTADRTSGPDWARPDQAYRSANHETTGWPMAGAAASPGKNIDAAAAAAYRASLGTGRPLSERKLAAMFGTTSRRWARHRMAEARQDLVSAMEDSR
jgi:hypothetical protein